MSVRDDLSPVERSEELILMGLRLTEGIDRRRFHAMTGSDLLESIDQTATEMLAEAGFITIDENALRATPAGRLRLNALLTRLLP